MSTVILVQSASLIFLLCLSALFSSSEIAFFSMDPLRIRRLGEWDTASADRIKHMLSEPTHLLSTILIANTVINVVVSVVGFAMAENLFPGRGEGVAIVGMTLLLLIFGEIGPKRIAMYWPEKLCKLYAPFMLATMKSLTPVRHVLENITETFDHVFRPRGRTLSEDEFESVVEMSEEKGVLQENERAMVKSVIRLEDLQAQDVMTPRVDIIGIDLENPSEDPVSIARRSPIRQLVLYRNQLDHIDGLLDTRGFLLDPEHNLQNARIQPYFVPETCSLDKLLAQFLRGHRRAAVVVDEYGGTAGIVTRGDILEEITGDIDDEHASHAPLFESMGPNRWMVDGAVSLEEINNRLDLDLNAEGVDRLSGWIVAHMGRLPHVGENISAQGCRAIVQHMRRHRITLVLLEKLNEHKERKS